MLQNLETALAGGLGQMPLVNDYQTFQPNLGSSLVVVQYRACPTYFPAHTYLICPSPYRYISHHVLYWVETSGNH